VKRLSERVGRCLRTSEKILPAERAAAGGGAYKAVDPVIVRPYSCRMISDFQDLSDKIDQLAELTQALRRENAQLRQANAALVAENMAFQRRLGEAHERVAALLEKIPGAQTPVAEDAQ